MRFCSTQVPSKFFGDHSGGVTPVPIPNTEVKPTSADGTEVETPWESRTSPDFFSFSPSYSNIQMTDTQTEQPSEKQKASKSPDELPYAKAHSIVILIRRIAAAVVSIVFTIFFIWFSLWGKDQIETRYGDDNGTTTTATTTTTTALATDTTATAFTSENSFPNP